MSTGQGRVCPKPRRQTVLAAASGSTAHAFSKIAAMPWPPPMHMVSRPYLPFRRCISRSRLARMRPPVAPIGWPREMPEPLTFSRLAIVPAPALQHRQHLRREGLVELDQVDVVPAQAGPLEERFTTPRPGRCPSAQGRNRPRPSRRESPWARGPARRACLRRRPSRRRPHRSAGWHCRR